MPRKKKGGQSPARVPSGLPAEGGNRGPSTGYRPPPMGSNFLPSTSLSSSAKEDIVRNMQEMFSYLDPEVIYIVLSECDFKVENAMDSLLELSVAAADPQPISAPVSGFERTAAALLTPHHFAEPRSQTDGSKQLQFSSTSPTSFMTEDIDFLIDQEVQSLSAQEDAKGGQLGSQLHKLHEVLKSNLEPQCSEPSIEKSPSLQSLQMSGASSPLDELSTFGAEDIQGQVSVVNKHLTTETAVDKNIPSLDLLTSGRPSAFQLYTKQKYSDSPSETAEVMASDAAIGETILKSDPPKKKMDSSVLLPWNTEAPVFYPQVQENQGPAFITPVASNWPSEHRPAIPWHRPVSQEPLRPTAAIPRSWALPSPKPTGHYSRLRLEGKVLVLLRGAPGSGKSTLARALLEHNTDGVILSTDDYFKVNGEYHFDPTVLGEAHSWNHNQARLAFERGANPIIIDNTNMHGWEMKPYVVQALKHNYKVLFREPDTWWKTKPRELERRTTHRVPLETIRRMLCGYERFVTVKSIMGSQMPEWKQQVTAETGQLGSEVGSCPDLVGEPNEKNNKSHSKVVSSLPDVSTTHDSNYFGCTEKLQENADMDMGALDSELDRISVNQVIPDCIVESVINKDHSNDELPVAFSESIGQRVKRKRAGRRSSLESLESADMSKNTNKSEDEDVSQQREYTAEGSTNSVEVKLFDFEGDWPSGGSLDQRQARRHGGQHNKDNKAEEAMELHKHLDLIQTGAAPTYTDCSPLSSLSPSSGDELNTDVKTEGTAHEPHRSQSENEEQSRKECITVELPDCVSDSKATELTLVRENEVDKDASASQNAIAQKSTENIKELVKEELDCGEVCESPEFESLVETESSQMGDVSGSQERKQRHIRRSGKQCKLALTFTQNCKSSVDFVGSTAAAFQTDVETNLELKPDCNFCIEPNMKLECEACLSSFTQTESQDFALLWRVNHQDSPDTSDFSILCGDPTGFVPEMSCATAAIKPTNHKEVPYYVVHEKSTQVEEKELGSTQDRLENLHLLRRYFKLVTVDTLEDLYEKCQQDLEWTTNLLLDSGERFFRDDESEEEEDRACTGHEDEPLADNGQCSDVLNTLKFEEQTGSWPDVVVEEIQHSTSIACEPYTGFNTNSNDSSAGLCVLDSVSVPQVKNKTHCDTTFLQTKENVPVSDKRADLNHSTQLGATWPQDYEGEVCGGGVAGAERTEGLAVEIEDDISSMGEVHRLVQAELKELEREEKDREGKVRKKNMKKNREQLMDIKSVELKLPTELALQLTELFGPVGIDLDTGSPEDYVIQMDLNLAKLLHQKWKEIVQERQKQAALSFHLLQESSAHWGKSQQWAVKGSNPGLFQVRSDGTSHLDSHPDAGSHLPFMDHWNVSQPHVSMRDIIKEEVALQENREKARQSRADLDKRDGATLLKEDQLFALFPTIDRHFLQDIFRDHNYSLSQTELFLHSLLDEGPVKTVVAPATSQIGHPRATSKDREKKPVNSVMPDYQNTEDPEYQDFRAEANLQRRRQLESFAKAAEAYKQGHKEVASFYAQQGHLHGQRMREANHRAAVQIFERVNSSLLPRNILDLHGLHVDEALEHLTQVLEKKTTECEQGLCRPQLSVITGRGNHSQGGVARIRPAVIDYLTNKHYRFTEPKPGLVLVSLK